MCVSHLRVAGVVVWLAALMSVWPAQAQDEVLRREVQDWLAANYFDSDVEFAAKVRTQVEEDLKEGDDFLLTFGPGVMKSNRGHQVHVFAGRFYTFELTEAQAKALLSGPDGVKYAGGKRGYQIEPGRAFVWHPQIRSASNLGARSRLAGTILFESRDVLPEKLAVRMTVRVGGNTTQKFSYLNAIPNDSRGTFSFSFDPLQKEDDEEKTVGPLVVFLDLCEIAEELDPQFNTRIPKIKVYSNSVPMMLEVVEGGETTEIEPEPAAPVKTTPSLVGSRWRFGGTQTTVEFLADGKFLWTGAATNGFWKQEGTTVTINVNNFTLFQFTLEGDKMTGTWERLQGEDVGEKNFSSLQRIQ